MPTACQKCVCSTPTHALVRGSSCLEDSGLSAPPRSSRTAFIAARLFKSTLAIIGAAVPGLAQALPPPPPPPPMRDWPGSTQGIANNELYAIHARAARLSYEAGVAHAWSRLPQASLPGAPPFRRAFAPHAVLLQSGLYGAKFAEYRFTHGCEASGPYQLAHPLVCSRQLIVVYNHGADPSFRIDQRIEETFDAEATATAVIEARRREQLGGLPMPDVPAARAFYAWALDELASATVFDERTCGALESPFPQQRGLSFSFDRGMPEGEPITPPIVPAPLSVAGDRTTWELRVHGYGQGVLGFLVLTAPIEPVVGPIRDAWLISRAVTQTCEPVASVGRPWQRPNWATREPVGAAPATRR